MFNRKMMKRNIDKKYDGYEVIVAKSVEEVEKNRSLWEKLQWHPNADIDFFLTIVGARDEIRQPYVFIFKKNGTPEAMVVGRIEDHRIKCKVGYKTIYNPKIRLFTIVYGGVIGVSKFNSGLISSSILSVLENGEADSLYFHSIKSESLLIAAVKENTRMYCNDYFYKNTLHWNLVLPDNKKKLFSNMRSKHRSELRRLSRVLEKKFPERIRIQKYEDAQDVEVICEDAEEITKKTYLRGLEAGFINNIENKKRLNLEAEKGWLLAYILYIDDNPSAFWLGSVYGKTLFLTFTGFDPRYRKYEIGTILLIRLIEDAVEDKRIENIDFGFGEALYKKRFCNQSWDELSYYIFTNSPKGIRINGIKTIIQLVDKLTHLLSKKLNIEEKIKRYWRNRLTERSIAD